mmetsp:Transcript_66544/g.187416  ORF Transcript_66544/g.187416 Transcript_66544/m.187416 type:complete len:498 (-) Transcript_66544:226-1719(-)
MRLMTAALFKQALAPRTTRARAGLRRLLQAGRDLYTPARQGTENNLIRKDCGLYWHPTKDALLRANPGPVLVAMSYEAKRPNSADAQQVRKYSSFDSHWAYWDCISRLNKEDRKQNLHEIFPEDSPRCLYFDIDGGLEYRGLHPQILSLLPAFVRWFFSGDVLGWAPGEPEPVVLTSSDPKKYSCHVVFPQIQFKDFAEQREYMNVLLNALPLLKLDMDSGESVPILDHVVDRVPYSRFQLFRGPYACKVSGGRFRPETCLEPEGHFRSDPLASFASRIDPDYKLQLAPLAQLLEGNPELRHAHQQQSDRVVASLDGSPREVSPSDLALLYRREFQHTDGGSINFAGLTPLEQYELALQAIHQDRASQWWSWFRISGVTSRMLNRYRDDHDTCRRIWTAHHTWSSSYIDFDANENVETVRKAEGRQVSGLSFLLHLVRFDHPNKQVCTSIWQHNVFNNVGRPSRAHERTTVAGTVYKTARPAKNYRPCMHTVAPAAL